VRDLTSRLVLAAHALMAAAMVAMVAPTPEVVPPLVGATAFAALGVATATAAARGRGTTAWRPALHASVGCAAMVVMHARQAGRPSAIAGHAMAGHAMAAGSAMGRSPGPGAGVLAVALLFAGYFLVHAGSCLRRAWTGAAVPVGRAVTGAGHRLGRAGALAHLGMSASMAVMSLTLH
jgi:hypothetical protein